MIAQRTSLVETGSCPLPNPPPPGLSDRHSLTRRRSDRVACLRPRKHGVPPHKCHAGTWLVTSGHAYADVSMPPGGQPFRSGGTVRPGMPGGQSPSWGQVRVGGMPTSEVAVRPGEPTRPHLSWPLLMILFLAWPVATSCAAADAPTDAEISRAVERGTAFVRNAQEADGTWNFTHSHQHRLGMTALAGLAFMENGSRRRRPGDPGREASGRAPRRSIQPDL